MKKWLVIFAWLVMSQANSQPIQVQGVGFTFDEAKTNGLKTAIQVVVGSVILANKEVNNGNLQKNEILDYSAGYIDSYKIISSTNVSNTIVLSMDVWVKSSKISERILGVGNSDSDIDGIRHTIQMNTFIKSKQDGDRLLQNVLHDFPNKAFTISHTNYSIQTDAYRNLYLVMPLEIKWNYNYVVAFTETMNLFSAGNNEIISPVVESMYRPLAGYVTVMIKKPTDIIIGTKNQMRITDANTYNMVRQWFTTNQPRVLLEIKNRDYNVIFKSCFEPENLSSKYPFYINGENFLLYGNSVEKSTLTLKITHFLQNQLKDFYKLETKMVSIKECL